MSQMRQIGHQRVIPALVTLAVIGLASLLAASSVQAQPAESGASEVKVEGIGDTVRLAGASVSVTGSARSIWAAGATVSIDAVATGSVSAAGADVTIDSSVGKSIRAAGSHIAVRGVTGGQVWLAGGDIRSELTTGANLYAAGGNVAVGPGSDIGGKLSVAGGNVVVEGRVRGRANLAGGSVMLNARVDGTVTVAAKRLVLGPQAVLLHDLVLVPGTEVDIRPGAQVTGETRSPVIDQWWSDVPGPLERHSLVAALFLFGATFVTGIGMIVLARSSYIDAVGRWRGMPITSFIVGVAAVILIPIVAVAVGMTVIGIPLAFMLLLVVPIILIAGYAVAALAVADWIFNRRDVPPGVLRALLFLLIGAFILAVVGLVPWVGPPLVLIVALIGAGAFLRVVWRRLRRSVTVVPT